MVDVRQARLYGQRDLKVEVGQVPEPGAGQVLLKMAVGGICGSGLAAGCESLESQLMPLTVLRN